MDVTQSKTSEKKATVARHAKVLRHFNFKGNRQKNELKIIIISTN